MKKFKKHSLRMIFVLVCTISVCLSGIVCFSVDDVPEGYDSWEDYFNSQIYSDGKSEIKELKIGEMEKVAENQNFTMVLYPDGLDFYIIRKSDGKIWGTGAHKDIFPDYESDNSSLFEMTVVDENESIKLLTLSDINSSDFSVSCDNTGNGVTFYVSDTTDEISFNIEVTLTDDGFDAVIPESSLKEKGKSSLLSLHLFPFFGMTKAYNGGYALYPDGSGALVSLKKHSDSANQGYTWQLYGTSSLSVQQYEEQKEQGIHNVTLPLFGIKQEDGGFLEIITSGDTTASLNLNTSDYYRMWFNFDYRMYTSAEFNYTGSSFGGGSISKLLPQRIKGDRAIKVFLLEKDASSYSDMANVYRKYLEENKIIKRLDSNGKIPVSIDVFMSATKSSMLGDKLQIMTTFEQTRNMAEQLKSSGVDSMQLLLEGWASGGYECKPTSGKAEVALGGVSDYKKLAEFASDNGYDLFLGTEFLMGDSTKSRFNKKKDILRNLLGKAISDGDGKMFMMNPSKTLKTSVNAVTHNMKNSKLCLKDFGNILPANFYEKNVISRAEIAKLYGQTLKKLAKSNKACVSGGNYYVIPYADRIYDLPDDDSGYYQNEKSVPFYQMVFHGYKEYSSYAGNLSDNLNKQKLKWIETGSIPHFYITEKSSVELKNTGYNQLFSSEFGSWNEKITAVYKEFNTRLNSVWDSPIIKHESINNSLVKVTYENGNSVYLNYGETDLTVDGITVKSMDYSVNEVVKE